MPTAHRSFIPEQATSLMEKIMPTPALLSCLELDVRPDRGVEGPEEDPFLCVHVRTAREGALNEGSVSTVPACAGFSWSTTTCSHRDRQQARKRPGTSPSSYMHARWFGAFPAIIIHA